MGAKPHMPIRQIAITADDFWILLPDTPLPGLNEPRFLTFFAV